MTARDHTTGRHFPQTCRPHGAIIALAVALIAGACAAEGDRELLLEPPFPPPVPVKPPAQPAGDPQGHPDGKPMDHELACPTPAGQKGSQLPVWDLFMERSDWAALHADVEANVRVDALLCIDDKPHPITAELQGASTRKAPKKSFDLKLRRGVPLTEPVFGEPETRTRVLLKAMFQDQSLYREALAFDMWRALGFEAPRVGHVHLRINGAYWGLYVALEPVDEDYLAHHGYEAGGRLYKAVRKHGSFADFRPGRKLMAAFENKTDDPAHARWDDLEALVETLQRTPTTREAFEREIEPIFPLAAYLDRLVWVSLTQNSDAVAQNFFLYNTERDGHDFWQLLPWDSNLAFGADWTDPYNVVDPSRYPLLDGGNHFSKRLLSIDHYARRYVDRYRHVLDEILTESVVLEMHRRYADRLADDLALDQTRWHRAVTPSSAFDAIEDFLRQRPAHIDEALDGFARGLPPADDDRRSESDGGIDDRE